MNEVKIVIKLCHSLNVFIDVKSVDLGEEMSLFVCDIIKRLTSFILRHATKSFRNA